ncbi:MAG: hypothetical protein ABGX27_00230 [Desulfurobacteriaceae bacterium]
MKKILNTKFQKKLTLTKSLCVSLSLRFPVKFSNFTEQMVELIIFNFFYGGEEMLMYLFLFVKKSTIIKDVRSKGLLSFYRNKHNSGSSKRKSSNVSKKYLQIQIPDNKEKEVKKLWKKARAFGIMESKPSWQVLKEALKLYIRKKSKC